MNDLGIIASGAGLRDGLNPCIFMACAVLIAWEFWFSSDSLRMFWRYSIFAVLYALGFLSFNFGPAQIFVFQKSFMIAAKIIYFVLGAGAFVWGILLLKDWFLLVRNPVTAGPADEKIKSVTVNGWIVGSMMAIGAAVLSALATVWPINNYVMLLGNEALLKGQWQVVMPLLGIYVFVSMWPLWMVWAFLSIKNLRPSLMKIICASVFFTASSSMIFIFK